MPSLSVNAGGDRLWKVQFSELQRPRDLDLELGHTAYRHACILTFKDTSAPGSGTTKLAPYMRNPASNPGICTGLVHCVVVWRNSLILPMTKYVNKRRYQPSSWLSRAKIRCQLPVIWQCMLLSEASVVRWELRATRDVSLGLWWIRRHRGTVRSRSILTDSVHIWTTALAKSHAQQQIKEARWLYELPIPQMNLSFSLNKEEIEWDYFGGLICSKL